MQVEHRVQGDARLAITMIGALEPKRPQLVWGHGWGLSGAALAPLAEALKPFATSWLIDFPGFGQSPHPPDSWGTAEYAEAVADWLGSAFSQPVVWIGHSFGGRVGLQLAARRPDLIRGMVLIASAGLQRQRSWSEQLRFRLQGTVLRAARRLVSEGPRLDALRNQFGSRDYQSAGRLRPVFVRVVGEDLTDVARQVECPTLLIYGRNDTETPPEMGERFEQLIPRSELVLLEGFDHLSVLNEGRHQVVLKIRQFLEQVAV